MNRKLAVVTGSCGGIGHAICDLLTTQGWRVAGLDVRDDSASAWPSYQCDLSVIDQVRQVLDQIRVEHGVPTLLVNNAGVFHGKGFLDTTVEDFDQTFTINIRAMFFATQHVVRQMMASGQMGSVVNIASVAGHAGSTTADYGSSKGAVIAFTKSVGKSLAREGIRVNAVSPGLVLTKMGDLLQPEVLAKSLAAIPLQRRANPAEIAAVVAFLASDAASYMSASVVDVNGGLN